MRSNLIFSTAAVAALVAGGAASAHAADALTVDSAVTINSTAPVPGAFTAGTWTIADLDATHSIPAGTTYTVKFSGLVNGASNIGATTVTAPPGFSAKRVANGTYEVTVLQEVRPGFKAVGLWSMADTVFNPRATVTISTTSFAQGAVDTDATNNVATYNNQGKGF